MPCQCGSDAYNIHSGECTDAYNIFSLFWGLLESFYNKQLKEKWRGKKKLL